MLPKTAPVTTDPCDRCPVPVVRSAWAPAERASCDNGIRSLDDVLRSAVEAIAP
jgi:hypothetical protein